MFSDRIDGPVVAVGDVHGELGQLQDVLGRLEDEGLLMSRWVVFLGDYVDGGPDTAGVIQWLLDFRRRHPKTICLAGNHDLNLAKALGLVPSPHQAFYWARIPERNRKTLASYGAADGDALGRLMPEAHKRFLTELPWVAEHPNYLFVHCGFDPESPIERQLEELRRRDTRIYKPSWLHENAWGSTGHGHLTDQIVVAGHTIVPMVAKIGNKVLLDTGAGYGGALSALMLPEGLLVSAVR